MALKGNQIFFFSNWYQTAQCSGVYYPKKLERKRFILLHTTDHKSYSYAFKMLPIQLQLNTSLIQNTAQKRTAVQSIPCCRSGPAFVSVLAHLPLPFAGCGRRFHWIALKITVEEQVKQSYIIYVNACGCVRCLHVYRCACVCVCVCVYVCDREREREWETENVYKCIQLLECCVCIFTQMHT